MGWTWHEPLAPQPLPSLPGWPLFPGRPRQARKRCPACCFKSDRCPSGGGCCCSPAATDKCRRCCCCCCFAGPPKAWWDLSWRCHRRARQHTAEVQCLLSSSAQQEQQQQQSQEEPGKPHPTPAAPSHWCIGAARVLNECLAGQARGRGKSPGLARLCPGKCCRRYLPGVGAYHSQANLSLALFLGIWGDPL